MSKEIKRILFLVVLLLFLGISGYSMIEDWDPLDALYMTVITLSTTGYKEIYPLSNAGRVLTMILIIFGITVFCILRGLFLASKYLSFHKFHFFMYLCTVEIAPVLVVVKLLLLKAGIH